MPSANLRMVKAVSSPRRGSFRRQTVDVLCSFFGGVICRVCNIPSGFLSNCEMRRDGDSISILHQGNRDTNWGLGSETRC